MPTVPLYWRSRAQTPHGASTAATRRGTVPPRCSKHRGWLVAPGKLARSEQPTQVDPDHDERYRGGAFIDGGAKSRPRPGANLWPLLGI